MSAHRVRAGDAHDLQHSHKHEDRDIIRLGVPVDRPIQFAHEFIHNVIAPGTEGRMGRSFQHRRQSISVLRRLAAGPRDYRPAFTPRAELAHWRQWGEGFEAHAVRQMDVILGDLTCQFYGSVGASARTEDRSVEDAVSVRRITIDTGQRGDCSGARAREVAS